MKNYDCNTDEGKAALIADLERMIKIVKKDGVEKARGEQESDVRFASLHFTLREVKLETPRQDLTMTSDRYGVTESGRTVKAGTLVTYLAHVSGGMVRVNLPDGAVEVMNPNCFPQLR